MLKDCQPCACPSAQLAALVSDARETLASQQDVLVFRVVRLLPVHTAQATLPSAARGNHVRAQFTGNGAGT